MQPRRAHDPSAPSRLFALDVLRGIAVALVLFRHMPDAQRLPAPLAALYHVGWAGVDLFFVLSGLLISRLIFAEIERTGTLDVPRFWLRRGFKIWPAYFAAYAAYIAMMGVLDAIGAGHGRPVGAMLAEAWPNVLFVQNYMDGAIRWPHSWSIAVEEHFYLALPLVLLALARAGRLHASTRLPHAVLGIAVVVLLWRVAVVAGGGTFRETYYPTHLRLDALAIGVAAGFVSYYHPARVARLTSWWPVLLAGAICALAVVGVLPLATSHVTPTLGYTLLALGFVGVVLLAVARPQWGTTGPAWITIPAGALATLGVYSYGVYLAHSAIQNPLAGYELGHPVVKQSVFLVGSLAGGWLLTHVVERPALAYRARRFPSRRVEPAGVPIPIGAVVPGIATARAADRVR